MKTTITIPEPQKAALVSKAPPHIRLANARRKKRISQSTMANWLGVTQGYLSQLESGVRKASPELLRKWRSLL